MCIRDRFGVYSTFIQRAYDQLSQDLCINNNPATILVFWGSLGAMNDVTHLSLIHIYLPDGLQEGLALDVAGGAADLGNDHIGPGGGLSLIHISRWCSTRRPTSMCR